MAGGKDNERVILIAKAAALLIASIVAAIGTLWLIFLPFIARLYHFNDLDPGLGILGALIPIIGFIVHSVLKPEDTKPNDKP